MRMTASTPYIIYINIIYTYTYALINKSKIQCYAKKKEYRSSLCSLISFMYNQLDTRTYSMVKARSRIMFS